MVNARAKGAAGEREFIKWLLHHFHIFDIPERNLEQVRRGGGDIVNVDPFVFEVKRQQVLSLRKWWVQVSEVSNNGKVPIVAYRQNRKPWKFLISATNIGLETGFIQLEDIEFIKWFENILEYTQKKGMKK